MFLDFFSIFKVIKVRCPERKAFRLCRPSGTDVMSGVALVYIDKLTKKYGIQWGAMCCCDDHVVRND